MKIVKVTPKYKYLECLYILKNKDEYSEKAVEKANEFVNDYRLKKPLKDFPIVTDEQRAEIKRKYPKTY